MMAHKDRQGLYDGLMVNYVADRAIADYPVGAFDLSNMTCYDILRRLRRIITFPLYFRDMFPTPVICLYRIYRQDSSVIGKSIRLYYDYDVAHTNLELINKNERSYMVIRRTFNPATRDVVEAFASSNGDRPGDGDIDFAKVPYNFIGVQKKIDPTNHCLLYTSPSPRDS